MANTIEAAPRSPAKETNIFFSVLLRKGSKREKTEMGLAMKVKIKKIRNAGKKESTNRLGVDSKPSKKKINI